MKLQENKIEFRKGEDLKFITFYYRIYLGEKVMKKVIILLMIVTGMSVQAEEILKKEEKVNTENNTNYIPETQKLTWIIYGFPPCDLTYRKCVVRGFKVDGEKMNESESYDLKYITNMLNTHIEKGSLEIIGHTDSTGSKKHNLKLSLERAVNAAKLLREYGLDKRFSIVKIIGKGREEPIDTNETVEGRYNNRRIEIILNDLEYKESRFINE